MRSVSFAQLIASKNCLSNFVLAVSIVFFLIYKVGFVVVTNTHHDEPDEVDDAYTYIWKAASIYNCGLIEICALPSEMKSQIFIENHPDPALQSSIFNRMYLSYSYLHNFALSTLHHIGFSWSAAYRLLAIAGGTFLAASIIVLGVTLAGRASASIGLLFLAPLNFFEHGLHVIVPSNYALAFFFFSIACLLGRRTWPRLAYGFGLCSAIAHPIGKLYFCVFTALSVLSTWNSKPYRRWCFLALSAIFLFLFPVVIELAFSGNVYATKAELNAVRPDTSDFFSKHLSNFFSNAGAAEIRHGRSTLVACFLFLPLVALVSSRHSAINVSRNVFFALALMGVLCGCSLLYVVSERHPGSLFSRVFLPYCILLCFILSGVLRDAICSLHRFFLKRLCACLVYLILFFHAYVETPIFLQLLETRIDRHLWRLSQAQIQDVADMIRRDDYVLYQHHILLFYSAVNGLYDSPGGLYGLPNAREDAKYVIAWNETIRDSVSDQKFRSGSLELHQNAQLLISNIADPQSLAISFDSSSGESLRYGTSCDELTTTATPSDFAVPFSGSSLCLSGDLSNDSPIMISSIRTEPSSFRWPWAGDVEVTYFSSPGSAPYLLPFSFPKFLLDDTGELSAQYELIDDRGSFLVFRRISAM